MIVLTDETSPVVHRLLNFFSWFLSKHLVPVRLHKVRVADAKPDEARVTAKILR
jgi:hypothetical protein